ncbi:MAG: transposase [Ignavibacteria bacterium]|nr:transposase [Ignavibacteria bacterium]MCU7501905.1 transposase [Ignavibacteria bacterium]MCU7514749.1 transposase [Ignavibacteria bacterium]
MANTYSQVYIHIVHSTIQRAPLIHPDFKEPLCKFITGVVSKKHQKMIAINCVSDHIHYFLGLNTEISIAETVRDIKRSSTFFINDKRLCVGEFKWQDGYGAFSYSHSQINSVVRYIACQEEHHRRQTFQEEYLNFLKSFGVKYNLKYVFG